jgi:zinc protease
MEDEAIQNALFPMAAGFGAMVDKEMTTFVGTVHRDNADGWYDISAGQLLDPGFRESDFTRLKTSLINNIRTGLRGNNDEELGNEVLYEQLYTGHPYGHLSAGHAKSVEALTLDDVKAFHKAHYTQANLTVGLAGAVTPEWLAKARADLAANLPAGQAVRRTLPAPRKPQGLDVTLVQKQTIAAAISMGFPIEVTRGHPDFVALNLVRSYLGEHRSSTAHLYQRMREIRGMNYGDYAYIEYFPGGMYTFSPPPNVARSQQAFRIWIRPVPPPTAHFAIRIAKYELDKLVNDGMSEADFEATRSSQMKATGLLTARQGVHLGYSLDQQFYGVKDYTAYIREGLEALTLDKVNAAIRKHLGGPDMHIVVVTPQAEALGKALVDDRASPMTYTSEKPQAILDEDKVIEKYPLAIEASDVRILKVEDVFE